jgi:poly(3-hydroxybutyrate) depolymerase
MDVAAAADTPCSASVAGVTTQAVTVAGKTRTFTFVSPEIAGESRPLPLVFVWHGRGGSGAQVRRQLDLEKSAAGRAHFVYPEALVRTDEVTGGMTDKQWDRSAASEDVLFFDAMRAHLRGRACFDDKRIFSAGVSNGGHFSNVLACLRGAVLRGIAPVIGRGPVPAVATACPSHPVAAWLANGRRDATVPLVEAEASRDHWRRENGCGALTDAVSPAPCVSYRGCRTSYPVVWCVFDGGHTVPAFAGPAVWSFFWSLL